MGYVGGVLVGLHCRPTVYAEVRMRLQDLGRFRARFIDASQMAVACRQKSSAFGWILHAVKRMDGLIIAPQIEVRPAKMPEILVRIKWI